jgi:DNA mismatch repair protein MutS
MGDLERLSARLTLNRATARDLLALLRSFEVIPQLKQQLAGDRPALISSIATGLDELADLRDLIGASISEDPPNSASEPGMIRTGYNKELDELRELAHSGKTYIAALEARERSRTGISTLKVKFNNVFGYFIEVSNAQGLACLTTTLETNPVNAERYTMAG